MQAVQYNIDFVRLATVLQRQQQHMQHMQQHKLPTTQGGAPPYKCSLPGCDRAFNRKYTLSEHEKTHTGEKPYVCPVKSCSKRFTTTGNLSRHRRLHGPVLPLDCPVEGCPCTFSSDIKLEKHMKFHFGTSVHLCEVKGCGKTFSTVGNLNRHMRNQHNFQEHQLRLEISTPKCRSPKSPAAFAPSPTGADDDEWLFNLAEEEEDDDDSAWLSACVANTEPLTLEEAAQPWDAEVLEALSLMLEGDDDQDETS